MANDVPPYYITNTVRCQINYFMGNNNAANVFHVGYTTAPAISDLSTLATAIEDWLTASWKPAASQDWSAVSVQLTDEGGPDGKRLSFNFDPEIIGSDVTNAMPANVTVAVKEDTGIRGRGRSGRWFWIGLSEAGVDGNVLIAGSVTAILAAMDALNAAIIALDAFDGMVVPHSFEKGVHLNPAESHPVVSFAMTDNSVDSQKDRLPFHKKRKKRVVVP